jgi:HSP20 family protein
MTLLRFDPFRELDRWSAQARPALGYTRAPRMPFDAVRREHELVLQFDLPGVDPETIDVTVDKGTLTVAAERTNVRQDGDEVVITERPTGRFVRELRLRDGLDAAAVRADYDAGVLTVVVPVAEAARPHRVQVGSGGERATGDSGSAESNAA